MSQNNLIERIIFASDAVSQGDNKWQGYCPVHSDNKRSLSVSLDSQNNIAFYCHAGCETKAIIQQLGLTWKELFSDKQTKPTYTGKPKVTKVYDYKDDNDNLVTQTLRYSDKSFRQRTIDPEDPSKWKWSLQSVEQSLVIYNKKKVSEAIKDKKTVYYVEGEKDADRLNSLGLVATTTPMGANKTFSAKLKERWLRYAKQLRGADIVVIPDNDEAGFAFARQVISYLEDTCSNVRALKLPSLADKEDVSDWLDKGNSIKELVELTAKATKFEKPKTFIRVSEKGKESVDVPAAAEFYIDQHKDDLIYVHNDYWSYTGKVWERIDEREIAHDLIKLIEKHSTATLVKNILYHIESALYSRDKHIQFNSEKHLINAENGVYNINEELLYPHNRKHYFTSKNPLNINVKAKCPTWLRFLDDLQFDVQTRLKLQEWAGYVFLRDIKIQKCLFLKGEGANGKSVFLETLSAIWSDVSSMELGDIFDRFRVAQLEGKLANVCTEADAHEVMDSRFKKLVSGEPFVVEQKYKDPHQIDPYAKIIFSCNDHIPTRDRSGGFFRRFDVLEFTRIFTPEEQDPDLIPKLLKEAPGIFNWAMEGLKRLSDNDWKMTHSDKFEADTESFSDHSNPLRLFLDENYEDSVDGYTLKDDFRNHYNDWCKQNGFSMMNMFSLSKELKREGFDTSRRRVGGKRERVVVGLSRISTNLSTASF